MRKEVIEFNLEQRKKEIVDLRSGDIVKVYRKIKEGEKERIQAFEGIIIAIKGRQSSSPMITVRKVSSGFGVELILPMYSPQIEKIELVKHAKVRRAKLYYMRDKTVKALKLKYREIISGIKGKASVESEAIAEAEAPAEKVEEAEEIKEAEEVKEAVVPEEAK